MFKPIKNMKIGLTFLLFLALIFVPAFSQEISSCTVIESPGTYYLTNDIYAPSDEPCIIIKSNDVTLDCQGYTIYGTGSGYGIITINETGATPGYLRGVRIKNCKLRDFALGIAVHGEIDIRNVYINLNNIPNSIGIGSTYGSITIYDTTVVNAKYGIRITSANVAILRGNTISTDRCLEVSEINNLWVTETRFNCYINLYAYGNPVTGAIYNNQFLSTGYTISIVGNHNIVFSATSTAHTCWSNYLGGCGIGGNYWKDYSPNCRNDNRDSFCDYAYKIPGTDLYDYYPLAEPQPFLCAGLETNVVYLSPTDSKTIEWSMGWNSRIARPEFTVVYAPSGFSVSFDTSGCDFNKDTSNCVVKVKINTNNVNTGTYTIQIQVSSGDCWYRESITVNVVSQPCSGSVSLTLNPSKVNPGGQFTATISGLSNCGGVAYIKDYRGCDYGETLATCQVSGSGCSATLNAPTNTGLYRYYACFDMNLDGQFTSGEYDYKDLEVITGPLPGCGVVLQSVNLTTDVYVPSDYPDVYCYWIVAPNVVFDCQGHTIYGNKDKVGILVTDPNVEIKNCRIVDSKVAISLGKGADNVVIRNNFLNATESAISMIDVSNVQIIENQLISQVSAVVVGRNTTKVDISGNSIAGYVAFLMGHAIHDVDIHKNTIEVGISRLLAGVPMEYLFYLGNGSMVEAKFYDNVVKRRPRVIFYSSDGTKPNIKLNIPPTDGISITYNMKIGGNFWWDFSEECEDNNFDNFCDTPYEAEYGIKDEYPLATLRTFYACLSDITNMGYYVHSSDITKPGEYRLGADIDDLPVSGLSCFTFFVEPSPPYFFGAGHVNNVVFDCQGHTIRYNGSLYVFDVLSATNFTLKNCKIEVGPSAKGAILYATYTNTVEAPAITLINNEIISHPPALIATAPAECELPEAPKVIPDITNDKIKVFLYNNEIVSGSTALKIYCALGEITRNNITATKCMQIGNPDYFTGFGMVKAVKVYDNMLMCDVNQPIVIDSNYPETVYAWNVEPKAGYNILGGGRIGGNFWYNYSLKCNDTNFDSFCDEPFVINEQNKDEYPLSSYVLSINIPPIPTYPMLTPASVFFMLALGFSAGLEYVVSRVGSAPFGLVFAVSFVIMIVLGSLLNILPGWIIIITTIVSAFLFGYIILRMVMGG